LGEKFYAYSNTPVKNFCSKKTLQKWTHSALAGDFRKESRWGECHRRSDFPAKDNENWKCHVVIRMQHGQLNAQKVRISELGEEVYL
jgi:hypothetical protein